MRDSFPILLFTHPACLDHKPDATHPDTPERLRALLSVLNVFPCREAPPASKEDLLLAHDPAMVERVFEMIPTSGFWALDGDTIVSPLSGQAALSAAGAGLAAVDAVCAGEASFAFCAVRPPGHHASKTKAAGFCLFNNVAIAALHALERRGQSRVAIIDFDLHHGNGTQDIFWNDPRVLYVSTHQAAFDPFTGLAEETGAYGNVVNVPLTAGSGGDLLRTAFQDRILPRLKAFKPDLLCVSAGFDAHRADPIGGLQWETIDYEWVGRSLRAFAAEACKGRVVAFLEGGYNVSALCEGAKAFVSAFQS